MSTVAPPDRRAEGAAWALSLLVSLSSLGFAVGAVVGWEVDLCPATPVTFAVAAAVVLGGPALAGALTLAVRRGSGAPTPAAAGPSPLAVPARVLRTAPPAPHEVRAERAQALLDWRDAPPGRTRA